MENKAGAKSEIAKIDSQKERKNEVSQSVKKEKSVSRASDGAESKVKSKKESKIEKKSDKKAADNIQRQQITRPAPIKSQTEVTSKNSQITKKETSTPAKKSSREEKITGTQKPGKVPPTPPLEKVPLAKAPLQKQSQSSSSYIASNKSPHQEEAIQKNATQYRFDLPPASNGATIVIIIDDAGLNVENARQYAELPFPITIAVLPKLPHSRQCADLISARGKEVILHQPMQSLNLNMDPGPGAIKADMTTYEIAQILKSNLMDLGPSVKGVNNHEGSLITSNVIKIGAVLDVCNEMGLYFLDSRTTAQTAAPQAALERDMHIFEKAGPYLDNDIDRAKMLERMRESLAYANRHGKAIVIGHVDKSVKILPALLREMYPEMKAKGYRFATPSTL